MSFTLKSPAFEHHTIVPERYTCDGKEVSPPLQIVGVPREAKSLVLIMEDPDAPRGIWDHWILFNIPPEVGVIEEGTPPFGIPGTNSWGKAAYGGPCPPFGTHRYVFKLYALDTMLELPEGSSKKYLQEAMQEHIVGQAELIGLYSRD